MKKRTLHSRIHSEWASALTGLFFAFLLSALFPLQADAKYVLRLWPMAEDIGLTRQQDSVALSFQLIPHQVKIPSGQALLVKPWLCSAIGHDSVALATVCFYGRNAYYNVVRGGANPFQDSNADFFIRARELPYSIPYAAQTLWQPWMRQGVNVHLHYQLVDGCDETLAALTQTQEFIPSPAEPAVEPEAVVEPEPVVPPITIPTPEPEVLPRILTKKGKAYVDFNVNSIDLVPTLRNNPRELQKIRATLDSLIADSTAVITRFTVTGYASPEGPYENNTRLASGRSETLCQYISEHWGVPQDIITSTFVAEDWAGLRHYIEEKAWPSTPKMLSIIDNEEDPDQRLTLIRKRFPEEYADIKENALPQLRHSDYEIEYEHVASTELRLSPFRLSGADYKAPVINPRPVLKQKLTPVLSVVDNFPPTAPFIPVASQSFDTYRALLAVKTNLLFDALLCPNVEVEMPLGRDGRWSVMGEVWFPWWRFDQNDKGKDHKYYRSDQRPTQTAYELLTIGAEVRYWLLPRCRAAQPFLTGTFAGLYVAGGKYDLGTDGKGDQGEFTSIGLTVGHSWALASRWNLELSASVGYVGGPKVHYENEFEDTHLIYRRNNDFHYVGPTKLKLSLAWLLGTKSKKGGAR